MDKKLTKDVIKDGVFIWLMDEKEAAVKFDEGKAVDLYCNWNRLCCRLFWL